MKQNPDEISHHHDFETVPISDQTVMKKVGKYMKKCEKSRFLKYSNKYLTVLITALVFTSFINSIIFEPVKGVVKEDSEGNLLIDGGSVHEINMQGGVYQMQGNITVDGSGSTLIIRNTTMKFLKGTGFRYNINVKNQGSLKIVNSEITVDITAGGFEEQIDISVSSSDFLMTNSSLKIPGDFNADSSNITINYSLIGKNPFGSVKDSVTFNFTDSNVLFTESEYYDIKGSEHIYLRGATNFSGINSFFNLTSTHQLRLYDYSKAKLYAISVQSKTDNNVIKVLSSNACAEIYRFLTLTITDFTGIPVGGASITAKNYSNQQQIPIPDSDILNYLGKSPGNYNITDYLGNLILPLRSDNITQSGIDYVGNYLLDIDISTHHSSGGFSVKPFPNFFDDDNYPSKSLSFGTLIPPEVNGHYSHSLQPLKITTVEVYDSPLQLQQNLIIDGGQLTVKNTTLEFNQTKGERFFVLIKNGGKLILVNSELTDPADWPLNVYVRDAGGLDLSNSIFDLNSGIITLRDGSKMEMNSTSITGSLNSIGPDNALIMTEGTSWSAENIALVKTKPTFKDTKITTNSIITEQVTMKAINTTINKALTFKTGSTADLTNVTFPGVASPKITIKDTSEVNIYWWLTVRVMDGGNNLLEKATVHVYNYTLSGQKKLYGEGVTNSKGIALFNVFSERRDASGSYKGIERNYFLNATYRSANSNGAGTLPLTSNKVMDLKFLLAADLELTSINIIGNLFAGNTLMINATVKNIGDFDLNTTSINVRFSVDGNSLGSDEVLSKLGVDESALLSKEWKATLGTHIINISVDPANAIGEKNENNNKGTSIITISVSGPDLGVSGPDIEFDPPVPNEFTNVTISAKITNHGEYDPFDNIDPIYVRFYHNDPSVGGTQVGTTQIIDSIPRSTSKSVSVNFTVTESGSYNIFVVVDTAFDSNPDNNKASRTLSIFTKADLFITNEAIKFLPSNKLIQDAPAFIRAEITNIGGTVVNNVYVEFYDGAPSNSGSLLGFNTSINPIQPNGGTVTVQIKWTPQALGKHQIFVVIDPNGVLSEIKTSNNVANKTVSVFSKPNLYINSDDISFSSNPIMEGEQLFIQANIHNDGEVDVQNVLVRVTLQAPQNPSIVPDLQIPSISANSFFPLPITWSSANPTGTFAIYIWIDPEQSITESNEIDNQASKTITITRTIDLRVSVGDIFLNNNTALKDVDFGKTVHIKARVWNDGGSPTNTDFIIQFFLSDSQGSTQLGSDIIVNSINAGEYIDVQVTWIANGSGTKTIVVDVDPTELVIDSNRANNRALREFQVIGPPDISVEYGEVEFSTGEFVRQGENIVISASILNVGETGWGPIEVQFYDGNPNDRINASFPINDPLQINYLEPHSSSERVNISWNASKAGVHEIYLVIDPSGKIPEAVLTNNIAFGILEVLKSAPDFAIVQVTKDPEDALVGTIVYLNVTLINYGNTFGNNVIVRIFKGDFNINPIGEVNFANISAGSTLIRSFEWTKYGTAGEYQLFLEVDPDNVFKEFNERNNRFGPVDVIVHSEPPIADIFFSDNRINYQPQSPKAGEVVQFAFSVENTGNKTATNVRVIMVANGVETASDLIDEIPVDQKVPVVLSWKPSKEGSYLVAITLDPDNEIKERDKNNNVLELNIQVTKLEATESSNMGKMVGIAIALVVIIVVLIAAFFLLVINKRRITEWAECSECRASMPLDATVCPNCEAEFSDEMECGECHKLISIDDRICSNCGAIFVEDAKDDRKKPEASSEDTDRFDLDTESDETDAAEDLQDVKEPEKAKVVSSKPDRKGLKPAVKPESKKIDLDSKEFEEFERELDEEMDELEKDSDIEDEESESFDLEEDEELPEGINKVNGRISDGKKTDAGKPSESGTAVESKSVSAPPEEPKVVKSVNGDEGGATGKDSKNKDSKVTEDSKDEDEDKEDFVIPGDKWTAECYKCNARIPLSASVCPECGAKFE